jgi:hypothetical protein
MHDAVLLLHDAISKTITEGGNPQDGTALEKNMQGRTFSPSKKTVIKMDKNAQIVLDFVLLDHHLVPLLRVHSVNASVDFVQAVDLWSDKIGPDECFLQNNCGGEYASFCNI